jgi:hypothetical protein
MRKEFEQEEYNLNDSRAKTAVRIFLNSVGIYTIVTEDYNSDIIALVPLKHEVEVKKSWIGEWPSSWDTVQIPERKKRLLNNGKVYFWVLKNDLTEAWVISGGLLTDNRLKEVPNKKVKEGERFFCIPIDLCERKKI